MGGGGAKSAGAVMADDDDFDFGHVPIAWPVYFGDEECAKDDRRVLLIAQLSGWFSTKEGWECLAHDLSLTPDCRVVMALDYEVLRATCPIPDVFAALDMQPLEAVACLGCSAYEVIFAARPEASKGLAVLKGLKPKKVVVNFSNYPESAVKIRSLKASHLGRIVTVTGSVVRAGPVRPKVTEMSFVCGKCGSVAKQSFEDGRFCPPRACAGEGCRSRTFAPSYSEASAMDSQVVRVQEVQGPSGGGDAGNVPRAVECELVENMVDSCSAGDVVTVTGIATPSSDDRGGGGGGSKAKSQFRGSCASSLYVKALSVVAGPGPGGREPKPGEVGDEDDYEMIAKLYSRHSGDALALFALSLCPGIYGNEMLKAGLVLALFGGSRKHLSTAGRGSKSKAPLRGDAHVLMVGDPGMGKSQMLRAVCKASHRGVYVTGNISTSTGLTASVGKDGGTGEFCLEAGAVVMADQGVCCVDEFDKMGADHQSLLEVMEQQEVSVAKAGLVASLPARATIVAAANPEKGHYDSSGSLSDNIKLSPALLSRFDLIFLMLDQPDEEVDGLLSEHVMRLHGRGSGKENIPALTFGKATQRRRAGGRGGGRGSQRSDSGKDRLLERIRALQSSGTKPVPLEVIQKCVAYARKHVAPVLTEEARVVLKRCYLELRSQNANCVGGIPITVRQLESMIRLAEARARCEMRERVTVEDAEDVVAIMRESLYSTVIDEYGSIKVGGRKKGKHAEAKRYLTTLAKMARAQGRRTFSVQELYGIADDIRLQVDDMVNLVEELNYAGELLKKGNGMYSLA